VTQAGQTYYQPTPLDFLILEALPDKGIIGGVHWAGRPVRHVLAEINRQLPEGAEAVGVSTMQARMRSMKVAGYVTDFPSHGSGRIWAVTPEGRAFAGRKEEVLGA
jgi:hypothetical protein